MWSSVIFNKSTEINAPPQEFFWLNKANGPELRKTSRALFAVKYFAATALVFCLISFSIPFS